MSDFDLRKLLQMVAPVAGGLLAGGQPQQTGFQSGYLNGQYLAKQEREHKQALEQKKAEAGAHYLLDVGQHAQGFDDPVQFAQFVNLAEDAGTRAGYIKPGDLRNRVQFPESKTASKKLGELSTQLDALEKGGYNLDELSQSGSHIELKDGTQVPIETALNLTRKRPTDATGKPVARPKKVDTSASTDYGRFLARYARERSKTVDTLTAAEELDARKTFNTVDDRPVTTPKPAPASADAQLEDLMSLWKDGHPGQEMPTSVRTQLRVQAKKDIGQADDKAPGANGRGANGLMPGQEFAISEKLAKTWQDTTKAQREMNRQFSLMTTGLKRFREGDKNGGSQGVLVTFQKILDPSSVVRESEYARSAAGISMLGRIEGYMDRLKAGGAGVPDAELAGMVETARQFLSDMQGFNNGQRKRIEAQAKKYSIDPALIFDDTAAGGGGPKKRIFYDVNGNLVQ